MRIPLGTESAHSPVWTACSSDVADICLMESLIGFPGCEIARRGRVREPFPFARVQAGAVEGFRAKRPLYGALLVKLFATPRSAPRQDGRRGHCSGRARDPGARKLVRAHKVISDKHVIEELFVGGSRATTLYSVDRMRSHHDAIIRIGNELRDGEPILDSGH